MPRQSIEALKPPPPGFRADQRTDDPSGIVEFEDLPSCVEEDQMRKQISERYLASKMGGRKTRRAVQQLLQLYQPDRSNPSQALSAASRVMMRDWRIRVCGWLWSLIAPLDCSEWRFFTIALPSWWVKSRDLKGVEAKRLMERLRVALHRAGSADASGWLYAMIHGEFDGTTAGFMIHVHGLATKGMIDVLRNLRTQPQFQRNKNDRTNYPQITISRKLKIDKPWGHLPKAITYTSKSYWIQHDSAVDPDGKRQRVGRKHRITGKHAVRHLLWLHSQPVKDQVLLVHISVIDGELVPGKRGVPTP